LFYKIDNTNQSLPQQLIGNSTFTVSCPTGYTLDDSDISNVRCYQDAIQ